MWFKRRLLNFFSTTSFLCQKHAVLQKIDVYSQFSKLPQSLRTPFGPLLSHRKDGQPSRGQRGGHWRHWRNNGFRLRGNRRLHRRAYLTSARQFLLMLSVGHRRNCGGEGWGIASIFAAGTITGTTATVGRGGCIGVARVTVGGCCAKNKNGY